MTNINYGIWNAALFGHSFLRQHGVGSIALFCTEKAPLADSFPDIPVYFLGEGDIKEGADNFLKTIGSTPTDIYVSHGCWLKPARVGYHIHQKGYKWVYVPHGMLEPWSVRVSSMRKKIYYLLFEKKHAREATRIRAVSKPEQQNLSRLLNRPVDVIENGVQIPLHTGKDLKVIRFLFLGRLHFKKGVLPLVKAWNRIMASDKTRELVIAGPDEGELKKIKPYFSENIKYVGAVYGNEKAKLLDSSHFFLLPSFSEGFPVSVIEAMSYGLIPMISTGCNFNEVFDQQLGCRLEPDEEQIANVLRSPMAFDQSLSERNVDYVNLRFSEAAIGEQLLTFYRSISA